jgi:hypothetical protein
MGVTLHFYSYCTFIEHSLPTLEIHLDNYEKSTYSLKQVQDWDEIWHISLHNFNFCLVDSDIQAIKKSPPQRGDGKKSYLQDYSLITPVTMHLKQHSSPYCET